MAIAPLQLPSNNINSLVPQSMWSSLGNLGNVAREAQAAQAKQAALASLGPDMRKNIQTLMGSGDPSLAQLGISLSEKDIDRSREDARYKVTDARENTRLGIQQAAARRAAQDWEEADRDRREAGLIAAGLIPGQTPPGAPPAAFPAPLPGASPQPALPPTAPPQVAMPPQPSAFEATPRMPAGLQPGPAMPPPVAPPVKAEGDEPSGPGWLQDAVAQPPDTSIVGRVASNLTSPHPTAAAGISRDQLAALYSNPLTRPLATAFLQKQLNPGEWKYEKTDDGRLIATNSLDPTKTMDVTPPTATGAPPATKEQRERSARFADAKARGYDDATANYVAINGKLPKEDLSPTEQKRVDTVTDMANNGETVIGNIQSLKDLSKSAWGFRGALPAAQVASSVLPAGLTPQGAIDTQDLSNTAHQNVALSAKAIFGGRITNLDLKLLEELETSASQPDALRQRIYTRVENMLRNKVNEARTEAEGIRNKTYYKPGGGAPSSNTNPAPAVTWKIVPGS